jgi:hypothetical protein
VEGTYILSQVPLLEAGMIKLQPKSLIKNCHLEFSDLKRRLYGAFDIASEMMKEWEIFFKENAPENDDVMLYIRRHTYHCPYASFFKNDIYNKPRWDIRPPTSSWSLFPPNVVIALPSIRSRWDPIGTNMPFMQIDSGSGTGNNSVVSRYSRFKDAEIERLKLIQKRALYTLCNAKSNSMVPSMRQVPSMLRNLPP